MNFTKTLDSIASRAKQPVDASSAALFRIIFGALSFIAVARFFTNDWIDALYVQPEHHLKYLGFEWINPIPEWALYTHFATLGILAIFISIGFLYRASAILFLFGFLYIELLDAITYLNHYYWLSLTSAIIIFMPLNRMWSIDAWLRPSTRSHTIPAWVIWLLRAQLAVVYFFGGIAKLNPDWLFAALPMKIWLYQHGDFPLIGNILQQTWTAFAMSWTGAIYDLTIVLWLLWHRTRPFAFNVLIAFHLITWQLFPALGMFPWLMIGAMLIFFPPDWPRRTARRLKLTFAPHLPTIPTSTTSKPNAPPTRHTASKPWLHRLALLTIASFVAIQIILPLRHWAYPGNVRWNEEGYRFAWRMMLSEKIGFTTYRVNDNSSSKTWRVEPDDYLTPLQVERSAINPDLIHQVALIIEHDFQSRGHHDISVYADAYVTFNGRPNAPIIDPNVDLTSVSRSIRAKHWILPAPTDTTNPASPAITIGIRETNRDPK